MVAKITVPPNIQKALNYNEQKVKEGKAKCLYANCFFQDAEQLNFQKKLHRFQTLNTLNTRSRSNTLHVSLNFSAEEKISTEKLIQISIDYMELIGFGRQPFLVYEHYDAGHPHIHIVSSCIQNNGSRILLHNLGKTKSTEARKELENKFNLVQAEERARKLIDTQPVLPQKINYGKVPTKKAIAQVLANVLTNYIFSSLAELNAVLQQYNVLADRGRIGGFMYNKGGLVYRVLDENKAPIGVPIKASSFSANASLSSLEQLFCLNKSLKALHKKKIQTALDWVLLKRPSHIDTFCTLLKENKVTAILRKNENGFTYGITYIDYNTKCVFNGSDIGKAYSAKSILEMCSPPHNGLVNTKPAFSNKEVLHKAAPVPTPNTLEFDQDKNLMDLLYKTETASDQIPYELRKRNGKKRKKY